MELVDITLNCVDCHEDFIFSAGEQQFFRDKGLSNPPKRCKPCKAAKTARFASLPPRPESGLYEIKCDQCGNKDFVPFYPTQGKPVYCRPCFRTRPQEQGHVMETSRV